VGAGAFLRALDAAGERVDDAAIPVERARGALFLMSGEDDQLWASARLAEIAEKRLRTNAFAYPFEHRRYANAGHFGCLLPNLPTTSNAGAHPVVPVPLAFGGTPRGNAAAAADLWPRVAQFLHRHLATRSRP
jgi:hypothetical protein